jgi:hypothetical protein
VRCLAYRARVEGGRDANYRRGLTYSTTILAMLDTDTGEVIEKTLEHEGDEVREFYSAPARS